MASGSTRVDGIERFSKCLKVTLGDMRKRSPADVIVCGSEKVADLIRRSLDYIKDDAHIVIDTEKVSERNWYITSHEQLKDFDGGGRN